MATNDANAKVIEEFRANAGKVGGPYAGRPLLLLTTTGRKSGRSVTTPVMYLAEGGGYCVFGSKGGAPDHPFWYLNLVATPRAFVEVGTERFEVKANFLAGAERDAVYRQQSALFSQFVTYQQKTARIIPVVRLVRVV